MDKKHTPDPTACLDAVKAALKAINREDLIPALDAPPPAPPKPWIAIPAGTPPLGFDNVPTPVKGFNITRCATTEHEWWVFCKDVGMPDIDPKWENSRLPKTRMSYDDVCAYAAWLTGQMYAKPELRPDGWTPAHEVRPPTEQEWEYAARGTDARTYPWGNEWDAQKAAVHGKPEPVDARPAGASPFGVLNMSGNVWEWTSSLWKTK